MSVPRVLHSGKARTVETAELLAGAMDARPRVEGLAGLAPNDPVRPFAAEVETWRDDAMVIGHLPFLSRLAGFLLCEDENTAVCDFEPGTLVCLEREGADPWRVIFMLRPDCLP